MKKSVYCTAVANGGEEEWDFAWDRYQKSNVATEKSNMLSSMGCTKEVICPYPLKHTDLVLVVFLKKILTGQFPTSGMASEPIPELLSYAWLGCEEGGRINCHFTGLLQFSWKKLSL